MQEHCIVAFTRWLDLWMISVQSNVSHHGRNISEDLVWSHLLVILRCWSDLVLGVRSSVAKDGAVDGFGVGAVQTVPDVATFEPRQLFGHGGEQVVEGPGNDDIVVEAYIQGYEDHSVAHTWGAQGH